MSAQCHCLLFWTMTTEIWIWYQKRCCWYFNDLIIQSGNIKIIVSQELNQPLHDYIAIPRQYHTMFVLVFYWDNGRPTVLQMRRQRWNIMWLRFSQSREKPYWRVHLGSSHGNSFWASLPFGTCERGNRKYMQISCTIIYNWCWWLTYQLPLTYKYIDVQWYSIMLSNSAWLTSIWCFSGFVCFSLPYLLVSPLKGRWNHPSVITKWW